MSETKQTDNVLSSQEDLPGEKTVIMDSSVLTQLVAESRPPPLRSEQPTLRLPRPARVPQG